MVHCHSEQARKRRKRAYYANQKAKRVTKWKVDAVVDQLQSNDPWAQALTARELHRSGNQEAAKSCMPQDSHLNASAQEFTPIANAEGAAECTPASMREQAAEFSPFPSAVQGDTERLLQSALALVDMQNATISALLQSRDTGSAIKDVEVATDGFEERLEKEQQKWRSELRMAFEEQMRGIEEQIHGAIRETLDAKDLEIAKLRSSIDEMGRNNNVHDDVDVDKVDVDGQPSVADSAFDETDTDTDPTDDDRIVAGTNPTTTQQRMRIYICKRQVKFEHIAVLDQHLPKEFHKLFKKVMPIPARCVHCCQSLDPQASAWVCVACKGVLHACPGFNCKEGHRCSQDIENYGFHLSHSARSPE